MKKIKILGTGCANCKRLTQITEVAVKEAGIECEIEKVTDIQKIMAFGVMSTPALVIDGTVKAAGRVPSLEEIKQMVT